MVLPYINKNQPRVYTCPTNPEPPSHLPLYPVPLGCPRASVLCALLHTSNLHWSSILHMVIYMLQCYSLKSSHPLLLPQRSKVCSLHLCLFCYLVYRVVVAIFLNSIYICINILYWCFSFWPSSLYIIGSSFIHSDGKASACNAGDPGSIPGSGRVPGEGNGKPLQYSCLKNAMDWGAW